MTRLDTHVIKLNIYIVDGVRVVRVGRRVSPLTLQGGLGAEGRRWLREGLEHVE